MRLQRIGGIGHGEPIDQTFQSTTTPHGKDFGSTLPHEPLVERSVHAAGTFAPLGRLECPSRIRWVGPDSSQKAALQNLRNSRPSRRLPPEGGVQFMGTRREKSVRGVLTPSLSPGRTGGEGTRRAGEGCLPCGCGFAARDLRTTVVNFICHFLAKSSRRLMGVKFP